jgi:hypothetical protein
MKLYIMNKCFYIPFLYNYYTRLKSIDKLVSWIIIYILPVLYFSIYLQSGNAGIHDFVLALLYIVLLYTLYEIGYIENDTETIKNENNPTIRLNKQLMSFYEGNKYTIYSIRIIFGFILSVLIYVLSNNRHSVIALILAWALLLVFYIYNKIRNIANLYLQILLVAFRYSSCQFLFFDNFNWTVFFLSVFAFPVLSFVERASDVHVRRFHQNWARSWVLKIGLFRFRACYYVIVNILLIPLYCFSFIALKEWAVFIYYLIYRTILCLRFKNN